MQPAQTTSPPAAAIAAMHSRDDKPVVTMSSTMATRAPGSRWNPRRKRNWPPSRST